MERDLYQGLIKGARVDGLLLFRINDGSFGKNPFDICGVDSTGRAVACEVKQVEKINWDEPLKENLFAEHQLNWLFAYDAMKALSLIVIHEKGGTAYAIRFKMHKLKDKRPLREWTHVPLISRAGQYTGWEGVMGG